MALHGRYTDGYANDQRVTIKFRREDLLWKTSATLVSPNGLHKVPGLPIYQDGYAIGPTILDMMVRQILPVTPALRAQFVILDRLTEVPMWLKRPTSTLWPDSDRPGKQVSQRSQTYDHPFQPGLTSGGRVIKDESDFVRVDKMSTISISTLALRLMVGMTGGIGKAYTHISALAVQAWASDLQRAYKLWERIDAADKLVEDDQIAKLRPISSISQEVERLIMRQACTWLGVDPDLDCSRPRGRPREASTETGTLIRITVTVDERLDGELLADFYGISAGTKLGDLALLALVELLGALRLGQYEFDADLVEAFLDAAAPDWREQAASGSTDDTTQVGNRHDPYEVLGVARDASLEEVTRAYRRIMQKVHPDVSTLGPWFAQMVSEAYRNIRHERGEHEQA